ncbi:myristoylated alanine-rich C-kinase substrate-like [Phymastichus coffea]|uniref:myristoylated alanine-rich C-kinase substrate-like n=1 Tax=Phymastichus coffea TaxID=108790 RepID=UPI00273BE532|nr:myristoylated alanine-rich C-kinase substrate-like [Phymastichus coffea]
MGRIGKLQLLLVASALALGCAERLSAGQRASPGAGTSADARSLAPPLDRLLAGLRVRPSGQTPADTSLLPPADSQARRASRPPAHVSLIGPAGAAQPGPAAAGAGAARPPDGVRREESASFKDVNGESVRVVVGNFGYDSPEGLPVSFKYMADENGNQASFSIGAPGAGGGPSSRPAGAAAAAGSRGSAAGQGPGKAAAGATKATGATGGDGDRKYLPPK